MPKKTAAPKSEEPIEEEAKKTFKSKLPRFSSFKWRLPIH